MSDVNNVPAATPGVASPKTKDNFVLLHGARADLAEVKHRLGGIPTRSDIEALRIEIVVVGGQLAQIESALRTLWRDIDFLVAELRRPRPGRVVVPALSRRKSVDEREVMMNASWTDGRIKAMAAMRLQYVGFNERRHLERDGYYCAALTSAGQMCGPTRACVVIIRPGSSSEMTRAPIDLPVRRPVPGRPVVQRVAAQSVKQASAFNHQQATRVRAGCLQAQRRPAIEPVARKPGPVDEALAASPHRSEAILAAERIRHRIDVSNLDPFSRGDDDARRSETQGHRASPACGTRPPVCQEALT